LTYFPFVAVENQKMMLGTFSPQLEPYVYEGEEEVTPAGIFARGSYSAKLKVYSLLVHFYLMVQIHCSVKHNCNVLFLQFVDDDGKVYLEMSYYFEIRKEWPATTQ
jgi:Rho GDP-dissociation inhibitor